MSGKENNVGIPAKLRVSDKDIEISGSEAFVSEQISKLEGLFTRFINDIRYPNTSALMALNHESHKKPLEIEDDVEFIDYEMLKSNKYENVVAVNGGTIQVLTDIPGESLKQRMINLILIYLFLKAQENKLTIHFSELKSFCERHAEIDKSNFSRIMAGQKRFFLISSDNKVTLTVPGRKEAQNLLSSLNA
jgi:hypothetical protein